MISNLARVVFLLALSDAALGRPKKSKSHGQDKCSNFNVPVTVDTVNYRPTIPPFKNQYEATEFSLATFSRTPLSRPLTGPYPFKKTFSINVEYCPVPDESGHGYGSGGGSSDSTLLLLTHGIGFDKSYWNFLAPPDNSPKNYSFIYHANRAGYSTLSYDRLGLGRSSHADPYTEVQAQVELAVLGELTALLRSGKLAKYGVRLPNKVVHVGHSFGSELGTGLAASAEFSHLSDAIVNTGYSLVTKYMARFAENSAYHIAALNQPKRFGDRSYGYLTWPDVYDNQYDFLAWPYFNPAVLFKTEATKQPFSWAEFETAVAAKAPQWNKPVFIMSASNDLIFCGSNCTLEYVTPGAKAAFPLAKPLDIYVQPRTGHGMNLHYNATGWYNVVFDWLEQRGL